MNQKKVYEATEVGVFKPEMRKTQQLDLGGVGYIIANIKGLTEIDVGDTLTEAANPLPKRCRAINHRPDGVLRPLSQRRRRGLRSARGARKLSLNDSALHFEPESSIALGFGFRCGFLGLLHMEIVQERLERNYNLDLIATSPSVVFRVTLSDGTVVNIDNPAKLPARDRIELMEEPYVKATVITPPEYVGAIMELTQNRRGALENMEYLVDGRVILTYEMPLIEVIIDYFDRLKSSTKGYASLDYEIIGYREGDLVKLEILLNAEPVDALSSIVARDKRRYAAAGSPRNSKNSFRARCRRADTGGHRRQSRRPRDGQRTA
jgi:GTP-binding protein LepA